MTSALPIPVHILSGFLGSGKTTLLNQVIKTDAMANSAVIINEFGEVGLDHHLVEGSQDTIVELSNGCLCCTVRGQLVETLEDLVERRPTHVLIETTGLADPVPVLQAVIASPTLSGKATFAGLITVFDALQGAQNLADHYEARAQVTLADTIIISKLDEITSQNREEATNVISQNLRKLNPIAEIMTRDAFWEQADEMLAGRLQSTLSVSEKMNQLQGGAEDPKPENAHHHHHHHDHSSDVSRHSDRIRTVTLRHKTPIEKVKLEMFLDLLLSAHGEHVLRLKGLAYIEGSDSPLLLQAVQRSLSQPEYLAKWPYQPPQTKLVVFLKDMEPQFVERLFFGFLDIPVTDTPDRQALQENPLSIPGAGSFKPN